MHYADNWLHGSRIGKELGIARQNGSLASSIRWYSGRVSDPSGTNIGQEFVVSDS